LDILLNNYKILTEYKNNLSRKIQELKKPEKEKGVHSETDMINVCVENKSIHFYLF
jgi:hypothetical protein